jgi:hypothetical protein
MVFIVVSVAYRDLGVSTSGVGGRPRNEVYPQPQRCPWESQDCAFILYHSWDYALTFAQTNVLVDSDGHIRVTGLGVTSIPSPVPRAEVDRFFHGAAPELIEPRRFRLTSAGATTATDVYAFGVLTFEVSGGGTYIFKLLKMGLDLCRTSSFS